MKYLLNYLTIASFLLLFPCCKEGDKGSLIPYENRNGLWGYKDDISQKTIIPAQYALAYPFVNNYAIIGLINQQEDKWKFGVIDTLNNYVLSPKYKEIILIDGYTQCYKDSFIQLFDSDLNEIIPLRYTDVKIAKGQCMFVQKNNKWACYDVKHQKTTTPFVFEKVEVIDNIILALNDTSSISIDYETGLIDQFEESGSCMNSAYAYTDLYTRKTTVTNKKGNIMFEGYDGHLGSPSYREGLMVYCDLHKQRKWGAIDMEGKIAIPFMYDEITTFGFINGFAVVYNDGMYGVINKKNELVLPFAKKTEYTIQQDSTISIYNDSIKKARLVDNKMNEIVPYKYDKIEYIGEGYFKVKSDKLYGIIDKAGRERLSVNYLDVYPFIDGVCIVRDTANKEGFINTEAEFIAPCNYRFDFTGDKLFVNGFVYTKNDSLSWNHKVMLLDRTGKEYIVVKPFFYKILQ